LSGESILSGDLSAFGLADIFNLLGMTKKGGVLRLTRGAETRTLHWDAGEIVFARSNSVRDSLGNFLVRKGIITPEQNAVSASKIDEATRHGKVLVRMGFITADQLLWAVKQQVLEIVFSLFHWQSGFFEFVEGETDAKEKITLAMSTTKVIMEGIHRLDEWGKFRAVFPDESAPLEPVQAGPAVAGRPDLTPDDKKIFSLVDGRRSLTEVVTLSRMGEFEAYASLFALHSAGALRVKTARSPARQAAS
jgi:hypothetical protein